MRSVVYASDVKGIPVLLVSLKSLSSFISGELRVVILAVEWSTSEHSTVMSYCRTLNFLVEVLDVDSYLSEFSAIDVDLSAVPTAALLRLFLPDILPDDDIVLYLDTDTLIVDDISDIFAVDLKGQYFAGVLDPIGDTYRKKIGIPVNIPYYNSGVLLCNLAQWRETDFVSLAIDNLRKLGKKAKYPDQDILTLTANGRTVTLPMEYNLITPFFYFNRRKLLAYRRSSIFYSEVEFKKGRLNAKIVHFTGGFAYPRPWLQSSDHPWCSTYEKYLNEIGMDLRQCDNRTWRQRLLAQLLHYKLACWFIGCVRDFSI